MSDRMRGELLLKAGNVVFVAGMIATVVGTLSAGVDFSQVVLGFAFYGTLTCLAAASLWGLGRWFRGPETDDQPPPSK